MKSDFEQIKEQRMYAFIAPDGSIQLPTMAPDYAMTLAFAKMMAKKGLGKSPADLMLKGFRVMPLRVTIQLDGDEESAFKEFKKMITK